MPYVCLFRDLNSTYEITQNGVKVKSSLSYNSLTKYGRYAYWAFDSIRIDLVIEDNLIESSETFDSNYLISTDQNVQIINKQYNSLTVFKAINASNPLAKVYFDQGTGLIAFELNHEIWIRK